MTTQPAVHVATEANSLHVGILGAGSIGCYLGGVLASRRIDTLLVARERIKAELDESGLTLTDLDGARTLLARDTLRVTIDAALLATSDVVLVAVKSGDTAQAGQKLSTTLPRTTIVVSMQNGLHNAEILRAHLPEHVVLAGIVGFNVVAQGNGVFRRTTSGEIVVEASNDSRIASLVSCLQGFGLPTALRADVRALQWSKLVMNLNNAISALTGVPTPQLLFDAKYRRILRAVISEAVDVMRRAGVATAPLGAVPVGVFPLLLGLPTPLLRLVLKSQLRVDAEARSSMWADLVQGRKTEVDQLNGEIVRLAESIDEDAPLNRRIVEIVHAAERRGAGSPGLTSQALRHALEGRASA